MGKIDKLIDSLAEDLRPLVQEIESSQVKKTKNHYGKYLMILSKYAKGNPEHAVIIGKALQRAGANLAGLNSALNLVGAGVKIEFITI
tara:strand:- start:10905 stop:11168 length:264 start_codon:yes stop_codon:yes gene_type:complete